MYSILKSFSYLCIFLFATGGCSVFSGQEHQDANIKLSLQATQAKSQTTTFNGDTLVFKRIEQGKQPLEYPAFTSRLENHQIVINGYYLGSSGFTPEADFSRQDQTIIIRVGASKSDKVINHMPQGYFYDAYLNNLSAGSYVVKIVHRNDFMRGQKGEEHTVFTQEFVVD